MSLNFYPRGLRQLRKLLGTKETITLIVHNYDVLKILTRS